MYIKLTIGPTYIPYWQQNLNGPVLVVLKQFGGDFK